MRSKLIRKLTPIIAVTAGVSAGLLAYYLRSSENNMVMNSWTTSKHPKLEYTTSWNRNWDYRDPKEFVRPLRNDSAEEHNRFNADLEKIRPKAVRHIILIRHGEYKNVGNEDEMNRLTSLGRSQAQCTGRRLQEFGIKWDKVVVSTMTRAKETAEIILKEICYDPVKVEYDSIIREGAPIAAPQPAVDHWKHEKYEHFRDGIRIEAGFRRYFHRAYPDENDSHTLIVCHANVIRYFVCRALQFPPEAWLRISLYHASITWLTIEPNGNVIIKLLGDSGFMPVKSLTQENVQVK